MRTREMRWYLWVCCVLVLVCLCCVACGNAAVKPNAGDATENGAADATQNGNEVSKGDADEEKGENAGDQSAQTEKTDVEHPIVVFTFSTGDTVRCELYPEEAPITVANFLQYVNEGFYTGTVIHRVDTFDVLYQGAIYHIPYVVQGGGFTADGVEKQTHEPIKGEFATNGVTNNVHHVAGALSMARTGDPNSASSQFFFCPIDSSADWDGKYAAFGHVADDESLAAIRRLAVVEVDENAWPIETITILSVRLETEDATAD